MPVSIPPFTPTALQPNSAEKFSTFVQGQPAAKTPLDGTELVPIIQNGTTVHAPPGSFNAQAGAPVFYVSPTGADNKSGTSPSDAWQTIGKVNASSFTPGTVILFQGGQTFSGAIVCPSSGTPGAPIIFGSYGGGQATISSGNSNGFTSTSQAGIIVRDLTFTGNASTNHGVLFQNQLAGNVHLQNIQAINLNVSGYGGNGILVLGGSSGSPSAGYDDVFIQGCNVTACCAAAQGNPAGASVLGILGTAGINIYSAYGQGLSVNAVSHQNIVIEDCIVSSCAGVTDSTLSGSGVVVMEVADCVIRNCVATNNGAAANNTTSGSGGGSAGGGPVGIFCQDAVRVIIESCTVTGQSDAKGIDGGGFDMDAGCTNCTIRDCYSSGNLGYGFSIESFNYTNHTINNRCVLQNCVTTDDNIKSGYAAIYITQGTSATLTNFKVIGCSAYYSTAAGGSCISAANTGITGEIIDCSFAVSGSQTPIGTLASGVTLIGGGSASSYQFNLFPVIGSNPAVTIDNNWGITIGGANSAIAFASSSNAVSGNVDLFIGRDKAGVLQICGNPSTVHAGIFAYNVAANTANYERGILDWSTATNVLTIGTQANGSGKTRPINIIAGDGSGTSTVGSIDFQSTNADGWTINAPNGSFIVGFETIYGSTGTFPGTNVQLGTDTHSRIFIGLNGADQGGIWFGPGAVAVQDVGLFREAAHVLQVINPNILGNATGFHVYNTTDAGGAVGTNYERGVFDWTTTTNVLTIGTQKGGSGAARVVQFVAPLGTNTFQFIPNGNRFVNIDSDWGIRCAGANAVFAFSGTANAGDTIDTQISRIGAGIIGIGTGAAPSGGTGLALGWVASGDPGGSVSTNTVSGVSSTTISTGTGTVKMSSANNANNTGWLKCYIGTQVAWIPCWTTNAP